MPLVSEPLQRWIVATALAMALPVGGLLPLPAAALLVAAAQADEDGDDDDDADDDDDDDGGQPAGSDDGDDDDDQPAPPARRSAPRPAAPPPPSPPPPVAAPDQVVLLGQLSAAERQALAAAGYAILREEADSALTLLRIPAALDPEAAIAALSMLAPAVTAAPNTYYRPQQQAPCSAGICSSWSLVGWPPAEPLACDFAPVLGVVDTGVNLDHAMLAGSRIVATGIAAPDATPSARKHGTAVVAMLVGDADSRVPGLVPQALVHLADPFEQAGADERTDAFGLALAIDGLVGLGVDVVNLSLAGPDNPILKAVIGRAVAQGVPVVAAVGNAGPAAAPLYPAGYDAVIAVTAVDAGENVYRRAIQGAHVDFAAPGVGIATAASISGVRPQTGTSFAAPFVTVALAAAKARLGPAASPGDMIEALKQASRDLGAPGHDPVFGWGLVQIGSPCPGPASP